MRGGDGGLCERPLLGREILKLGHDVRLVPPIYVKPFVKRQKNDAADAEAICEAAQRPTMRFVAVKGEEQQARAMLFHTWPPGRVRRRCPAGCGSCRSAGIGA